MTDNTTPEVVVVEWSAIETKIAEAVNNGFDRIMSIQELRQIVVRNTNMYEVIVAALMSSANIHNLVEEGKVNEALALAGSMYHGIRSFLTPSLNETSPTPHTTSLPPTKTSEGNVVTVNFGRPPKHPSSVDGSPPDSVA